MALELLRQLLALLRALLLSSKRAITGPWLKILRKLTYLWSLLRSCWFVRRKQDRGKGPGPPRAPLPSPSHGDPHETKSHEHETIFTTFPTTTLTEDETITLDSTIAPSLHPYPYIHHSQSRSSLNVGLRAARSAHSLAISSREASRSSHRLYLDPQSEKEQEYTFTLNSPGDHHPNSPTPRRGYSISSPHLGTGRTGHDPDIIDWANRARTSSPAGSVVALPAGISLELNHSTSSDVNLGHWRICPIAPEYFQRYDRSAFAEKKDTAMLVKSLTIDFKPQPDPPGWTPCLHPEGVMCFYNAAKKVVTEANLYDPLYLNQITEDINTFEDFIRANNLRLPRNITLALDLNMESDGTIYTDYYFADHDRKIVFFLDEWQAAEQLPAWKELKGVTSTLHLRHEMETQYWHHCMFYPSTMVITQSHVDELRDIILHYIGDATTSAYSTSPYSLEELYKMLGLVNSLEKNVGSTSPGAASLLSRMMFIFARQKFYNWHGLPEARIYRDKSVYGETPHRTLLIKTLSPLLFSAPDVHLKNLEKMWVDGIMHSAVWSQSIDKLNQEWQEFILYATVLLNANVAFLAIQSVDVQHNPSRTPVQVASYLSIVASIGSIILGLLLVRQNRTRAHGTALDVCLFLKARSHPTLGLETLAILYGLPYALLMWGMVSFLAAFAWYFFDDSTSSTRTIMAAALFAFAALVFWCIWMGWVKGSESEPKPTEQAAASAPEEESDDAKPLEKDEGDAASGPPRSVRSRSVHSRSMRSRSVRSPLPNVASQGELARNQGIISRINPRRWSWAALLLFSNRRPSYDSERTIPGV